MSNQDLSATDFAPYFHAKRSALVQDFPIMQSIYELRYQVYCVECGFLTPDDYPEGRESDQYDVDSEHFCAHNRLDELVGYVRLVPADPQTGRFPWQQFCRALIPGSELPPFEEAAEISRLMVRGDYRRRRGDTLAGLARDDGSESAAGNADRRVQSPQILLSLYRQMYIYSVRNGIRYWYAAMERPLARSLARMSFCFRQVGEEADYFGPVAPYKADLRELEARLGANNPALLAWMQKPDANNS